ncbi:MAG TPA: hypothetical protein VFV96_10795 [Verrucomicrobiae bacterium]|nr:hypothetical protein [Verrucomicrobiae bacterium]
MSKNQKGFWRALEKLATGAVMAEWNRELGHDTARARPYLALANGLAETYPCQNAFGCGFPHRVEQHKPGQWVAFCETEDSCPPFQVANTELFVFAADTSKLCSGIARALGLDASVSRQVGGVRALPVGTYGAARANVYLMFPTDASRMAREVERLFGIQPDPFLLLTPTGMHCSAEVESALRRQSCLHIPMSAALLLGDKGSLAPSSAADSLLKEFQRRQADGRLLVKTVERIDRNVDAVARNQYELRKENDELRQLHTEGYFKFALKVDAADFQAFAVIIALGNRKAAAEHLQIPHRSFYDRVDKWPQRGREYQLMWRFIEWRKRSGRHIKVRLDESLQSGESGGQAENPETLRETLESVKASESTNYPDLLADIFGALQRQNAANWSSVKTELLKLIREELPQ